MNNELLDKISVISDEEKEILNGNKAIKKSLYTTGDDFNIEAKRLLTNSKIAIKTHTRFIDFPLHSHDYLEMMYVAKGSITHVINHEDITLNAGDLIIMNKYLEHSIRKAQETDIGINFIISDEFLINVMENLDNRNALYRLFESNLKSEQKGDYLIYKTINNIPVSNTIESAISLIYNKNYDYMVINDTIQLLFRYLAYYNDILAYKSFKASKDDLLKEYILNYIKENIRSATLSELSERLKYSAEYTSRRIKKLFSRNFKDLLTDERILLALSLLKNTELKVSEIVNRVGYENKSYFHKEFKKRYGITPYKWRKS